MWYYWYHYHTKDKLLVPNHTDFLFSLIRYRKNKDRAASSLGSGAALMEHTVGKKGGLESLQGLQLKSNSRRDHEQGGFTGAWLQGAFALQSSRNNQEKVVWGYTTCKDREKLEGFIAQCTSKTNASRWHRETINPSAGCRITAGPAASSSAAILHSARQHSIRCNTLISIIILH